MPSIPPYTPIPPFNKDWLTPVYDVSCKMIGLGPSFKRKVLGAVPIPDGATIVDVGCGTGVFADVALAANPTIHMIGIDPDERAIGLARRRCSRWGSRCDLRKAFAEQLPLPDHSADITFSTLAFHHLPDPVKREAVFEMYRILKPGGSVVIADFAPTTQRWIRWTLRLFEHVEYLHGNFDGQIPRDLSDAGFTNVHVAKTHFPGIAVNIALKNV